MRYLEMSINFALASTMYCCYDNTHSQLCQPDLTIDLFFHQLEQNKINFFFFTNWSRTRSTNRRNSKASWNTSETRTVKQKKSRDSKLDCLRGIKGALHKESWIRKSDNTELKALLKQTHPQIWWSKNKRKEAQGTLETNLSSDLMIQKQTWA